MYIFFKKPNSLIYIMMQHDYFGVKIYFTDYLKTKLKNESVNINYSFIFYDENEQTFNYLYLN